MAAFGVRDVTIYSKGLVYVSACAASELTKEQVEEYVNRYHPTGVSSQWTVSDERFRTGEPNPCPCESSPHRTHWLLTC